MYEQGTFVEWEIINVKIRLFPIGLSESTKKISEKM